MIKKQDVFDPEDTNSETPPSYLHVPALVCVRVAPHVALLYHKLWKVRPACLSCRVETTSAIQMAKPRSGNVAVHEHAHGRIDHLREHELALMRNKKMIEDSVSMH